jgi:hypothetical protein
MAVTQSIHEFRDLGNNIHLWEPPVTSHTTATSAPSLIILCTWLGGSTTNRVDKFTTGYRTLFPNTSILLIRTVFTDISSRTFSQIRNRLAPARDVICRLMSARPSQNAEGGSIHLHIFSHGGCNTAIQLAVSMHEEKLVFPLRRIIFDCCPGDATYRKAYGAAALSLPTGQPINAIGKLFLHIPIAAITGVQSLGLMSSVRDLRVQLNEAHVFGAEAMRLYLYSKADRMVDFADVQSHMEDAKKVGYKAEGIMFERSAHCALPMEDAARYWQVVEAFWNSGGLSRLKQSAGLGTTTDNSSTSIGSKL